MTGKDKIFSTLEKVMVTSKADQTEAVFVGGSSGLTRFANSFIHQNVAVENTKVTFRVALGNKIGTSSCNSFVPTDLRKALKSAYEIARKQKPNPDFSGMASPAEYRALDAFDIKTAKYTPKQRAMKLKRAFAKGAKYNYDVAGAFSTSDGEIAVLNSLGVRCFHPYTSAALNVIATGQDSSGYASGTSWKADDLDIAGLADVAVKKCKKAKSPKEVEPGVYEVILEPAAIGELFEWLNFVAFGSKAFEENTSFLAGRVGEKLMGDNVTIVDDAYDPSNPGVGFDFEGVPKQRVEIISKGVAKGVVHNLMSAKRLGGKSTGHALPAEYASEGSVPGNLQLLAGSNTLDQLIEQVENGLLVTRFHYINGFLDPRVALMTGMTRDGLFVIKNGKIKGGAKNLRFTDSMLDVFSNVLGMTSERKAVASWWGGVANMFVPAVRFGKFKFTGKTDF